jgi:hypothetical protein
MEFRFFAISQALALEPIDQFEAGGSFAEIKFEVDRYFDNVVCANEPRQVIVLCTDMGKPPGCIVAVETHYLAHESGRVKSDQQVRTLVWVVEENVPKRR